MKRGAPKNGFTVIELLVAIAVLSLMVFLVAQLTDSATFSATNSRKLTDADGQARMVLDRMANDVARMVKRKDVDYIFAKHTGNDAFFFYSESPAYYDNQPGDGEVNTVSLVGYRINSNYQLERYAKGLRWSAPGAGANAAPMMFLTYSSGSATPDNTTTLSGNYTGLGTYTGNAVGAYSDGTDGSYHVIGDQVVRMELSYLLTDGSISLITVINPTSTKNNLAASAAPVSGDDSVAGYSVGSRWYDTTHARGYVCVNSTATAAVWRPIGVQDISAIIVTVAVFDAKSRLLVPDASGLTSTLTDATLSGTPPQPTAAMWLDKIYTGTFAKDAGIPRAAASQLRVYQRYLYLNQ